MKHLASLLLQILVICLNLLFNFEALFESRDEIIKMKYVIIEFYCFGDNFSFDSNFEAVRPYEFVTVVEDSPIPSRHRFDLYIRLGAIVHFIFINTKWNLPDNSRFFDLVPRNVRL